MDTPNTHHPVTDADICREHNEFFDPTVYAAGRFWRCLYEDDRWVPWPDTRLAAEVLELLEGHSAEGIRPTQRRIAAIMNFLRLRLDHTAPEAWQPPPGLLPLRTHLLDLATLELTPNRADRFPGPSLPHAYDPAAKAPAWQAFLAATIPDAAGFVQEFAGYCLTTDLHHELSLWLVGPEGSGKSTLLHGLQTLLGPRAGQLPLDALTRGRLDPDYFFGKTLLVGHAPHIRPGALTSLSALIAGRHLTLHPRGVQPITVQAYAKVALAFPAFPSCDSSLATLYPHAAIVQLSPHPDSATDYALKHRIAQEGPGLLNWALAGLRRLQVRGHFDLPPNVLATAQRLRLSQNAPAAFIEECCQIDPKARTRAIYLHQAFVAWCRPRGLASPSGRALAAEWRNHGFEPVHSRNGTLWCGIAILPHIQASLAAGPTTNATGD